MQHDKILNLTDPKLLALGQLRIDTKAKIKELEKDIEETPDLRVARIHDMEHLNKVMIEIDRRINEMVAKQGDAYMRALARRNSKTPRPKKSQKR